MFGSTWACVYVVKMFLMLSSCPFSSYESPDIALNCGIMLRECIRHEPLAKITLCSEQFYDFFRYVEMSTFDIASDAFATFKVSVFVNIQALSVCFVWVASLILIFRCTVLLVCLMNSICLVFFQDLLTRHKLLSAEFLEKHYDRVSHGSSVSFPSWCDLICHSYCSGFFSELFDCI